MQLAITKPNHRLITFGHG